MTSNKREQLPTLVRRYRHSHGVFHLTRFTFNLVGIRKHEIKLIENINGVRIDGGYCLNRCDTECEAILETLIISQLSSMCMGELFTTVFVSFCVFHSNVMWDIF